MIDKTKQVLGKIGNNPGTKKLNIINKKIKSQINSTNYSKLKKILFTTSSFTLSTLNFTRKAVAKVLHPERMIVIEKTFVDSEIIEKKMDDILQMMKN